MSEILKVNKQVENIKEFEQVLKAKIKGAGTPVEKDVYKHCLQALTTHCQACGYEMVEKPEAALKQRRRHTRYACYTCFRRMSEAHQRQRTDKKKKLARKFLERAGASDLVEMLGLEVVAPQVKA